MDKDKLDEDIKKLLIGEYEKQIWNEAIEAAAEAVDDEWVGTVMSDIVRRLKKK
jgi:hypothetical protein